MGAPITTDAWSLTTLWTVFAVGLAGGFGHCLGMCGGFVAAASIGEGASATATGQPGAKAARSAGLFQVGYHVGRLTTYMIIGGSLGWLGGAGIIGALAGRGSVVPGQRYIGLVAGLLTVFVGLAMLGLPKLADALHAVERGAGAASQGWFMRTTGRLSRAGGWAGVPFGLLLGLLPCGFLLGAEAVALASGSALTGAATMLAFGLGTVPALAGFGIVAGVLGTRIRGIVLKAAAVLTVLLGLALVWRAASKLAGMS